MTTTITAVETCICPLCTAQLQGPWQVPPPRQPQQPQQPVPLGGPVGPLVVDDPTVDPMLLGPYAAPPTMAGPRWVDLITPPPVQGTAGEREDPWPDAATIMTTTTTATPATGAAPPATVDVPIVRVGNDLVDVYDLPDPFVDAGPTTQPEAHDALLDPTR